MIDPDAEVPVLYIHSPNDESSSFLLAIFSIAVVLMVIVAICCILAVIKITNKGATENEVQVKETPPFLSTSGVLRAFKLPPGSTLAVTNQQVTLKSHNVARSALMKLSAGRAYYGYSYFGHVPGRNPPPPPSTRTINGPSSSSEQPRDPGENGSTKFRGNDVGNKKFMPGDTFHLLRSQTSVHSTSSLNNDIRGPKIPYQQSHHPTSSYFGQGSVNNDNIIDLCEFQTNSRASNVNVNVHGSGASYTAPPISMPNTNFKPESGQPETKFTRYNGYFSPGSKFYPLRRRY